MAELYPWLLAAMAGHAIPHRAVVVALTTVVAPFVVGVGVLVTSRLASYRPA